MATAVSKLESDLRSMIEPERVQFVELIYNHLKESIDCFLEKRKPNKTLYDLYHRNDIIILGLREATNYYEAQSAMWRRDGSIKVHPEWTVEYRPDGLDALKKMAERTAEDYIQTFLARTMSKLTPVVERKPDFTMTKVSAGYLRFYFGPHMRFRCQLQIKTNYTKFGHPYAQYPCTFHDAVLSPDSKPCGVSIEDIWASVGYVPPPTPSGPPRKRWSKVVSGSVVEWEGKPVFIKTPGQLKKLGIPADVPQLARIEANGVYGRIEYVDGTMDHFKWTNEEKAKYDAVETDWNAGYDAAKRLRMDATFQHFYPEV